MLTRSSRQWSVGKVHKASAQYQSLLRSITTTVPSSGFNEASTSSLGSKSSITQWPGHSQATQPLSNDESITSSTSAISEVGNHVPFRPTKPSQFPSSASSPPSNASSSSNILSQPLSTSTPSTTRPPISENIRQLLPLLKAQARHYITIHIHDKPYLVTPGDIVRLPFLMHGVVPGDILRLDRATVIGSRDFTLKAGAPFMIRKALKQAVSAMPDSEAIALAGTGADYRTHLAASEKVNNTPLTCRVDGLDVGLVPGALRRTRYIDDRLFECRAVVMGTESEPMRFIKKTKQRQRRVKTVKSKHRYTILRIKELIIKNVEDIQ